jgi:hypothetical protein
LAAAVEEADGIDDLTTEGFFKPVEGLESLVAADAFRFEALPAVGSGKDFLGSALVVAVVGFLRPVFVVEATDFLTPVV